MKNKSQNQIKKGKVIARVFRAIRRYTPLLVLSLLLGGGSALATLYIPVLAGRAIDNIIGPGNVDMGAVVYQLTLIGIFAGAAAVLQWLMSVINNRVVYSLLRDTRAQAFKKLVTLPLSYLDTHPAGDIISRIITDSDTFADGLLLGFSQFFTGIVSIVGTLIFMLLIDWKITLVVVVLTPVSLFVARFIASRTYNLFRKRSELRGQQTAIINESIHNAKLISAFSRERATLEKFDENNEKLRDVSLSAIFYSSITNPATRFVNSLVYAAVALTGAFSAITVGGITVGSLTSFLAFANQYTKPFNEISGVIAELQGALASAARIFELLDEEPEVSDADGRLLPYPAEGHVRLEDVSFSYTPERPLIEGLSLDAKRGQRIAIVGPTGCGKTTLINLLMRFYDVRGGRILFDGEDIRELTRHSLRHNYGMVLQDTWLSDGSIRDNIAMGKPDATDEEIVAAAKASHAHSFIMNLPDGYNTRLGEHGGSLSEGQRQLISISRIMLRRPPVLILDEATSSIDTRTELKIQDAFNRLMEGRTSFIVAHRLSTIRDADLILVMRDGHIVEQGRHDELLERGGFYSVLYNSQFAAEPGEA